MRRTALCMILALAISACGGKSPSEPTETIPRVSGAYSGSATFTYPELQATVTCPASTTVTQSGSTVSVAPLVLTGQCGTMSLPLGQVTIDATGAIQGESGNYTEPTCGVYNYTASGGFFTREFRLSVAATSSTCYNFNFTALLSR
jgi:hypothetical protein